YCLTCKRSLVRVQSGPPCGSEQFLHGTASRGKPSLTAGVSSFWSVLRLRLVATGELGRLRWAALDAVKMDVDGKIAPLVDPAVGPAHFESLDRRGIAEPYRLSLLVRRE